MIEVRIMHVPGTRPAPTDIVEAFAPMRPVVMEDPTRNGPWWNLRQCLTRPRDPATTHVLVLNDDVIPTPGVIENVRAVAAVRRPTFVSVFSYHPGLLTAQAVGLHWIRTSVYTWGCAQLVPVELIDAFLAFNDVPEPSAISRTSFQLSW